MAVGQYQGVNGVARKVTKRYQGVSGVARNVIRAYTGVNGVARQYFMGGIPWQKWAVVRESETYYKEDGWVLTNQTPGGPWGDSTGYAEYSFDKYSGSFSVNREVTIPSGSTGTLYRVANDTQLLWFIYDTNMLTIYTKTSSGPYYDVKYFKDDASYGTVLVPEGSYPDADEGYTYAATFTENGVEYVVMFDPETGSYYCYNKI